MWTDLARGRARFSLPPNPHHQPVGKLKRAPPPHRRAAAVLAYLLLAAAAPAQPLGGQLHQRISAFPASVSLYAKNLDSGESIGIREAEPVRTASTIKLAVMAALFDAVARGELAWSERLTIT